MPRKLQVFETPEITVTFAPDVCRHTGVCLRGLPEVFDVRRKRWKGRMAMALLVLAAGPVAAQQGGGPASETALLAGPSSYDLSGTGTGFAANLSSTVRLAGRVLLFSPNFGYFTYRTQFGSRRHLLFPEAGFQLQAPMGRLRPYLGAGAGVGIDTRGSPSQLDFTLHAAAGFRLRVRGDWGVRGELRVRSVDPFHGDTADFGVGISRGVP